MFEVRLFLATFQRFIKVGENPIHFNNNFKFPSPRQIKMALLFTPWKGPFSYSHFKCQDIFHLTVSIFKRAECCRKFTHLNHQNAPLGTCNLLGSIVDTRRNVTTTDTLVYSMKWPGILMYSRFGEALNIFCCYCYYYDYFLGLHARGFSHFSTEQWTN